MFGPKVSIYQHSLVSRHTTGPSPGLFCAYKGLVITSTQCHLQHRSHLPARSGCCDMRCARILEAWYDGGTTWQKHFLNDGASDPKMVAISSLWCNMFRCELKFNMQLGCSFSSKSRVGVRYIAPQVRSPRKEVIRRTHQP